MRVTVLYLNYHYYIRKQRIIVKILLYIMDHYFINWIKKNFYRGSNILT